MSFGLGVKTGTAGNDSARAIREGRTVFVYRQNIAAIKSTGWSGSVPDVAQVIEVVEANGWRLNLMNYDENQSSKGAFMLLFRRK